MNGGVRKRGPRGLRGAFRTQASKRYSRLFWPNGGPPRRRSRAAAQSADEDRRKDQRERRRERAGILVGFEFKPRSGRYHSSTTCTQILIRFILPHTEPYSEHVSMVQMVQKLEFSTVLYVLKCPESKNHVLF